MICLIQMSNKGSKCGNVTFTAFSSHSFRVQTWQFWGKCVLQRWFSLQFWQHCLNKTYVLHTELQYDSLADSFCFGICNTQTEVLLSKQVNYNQVVVKCQILQGCFLQNFNMQKFQNMEHSNSRTFEGLTRTFKDLLTLFSRTFKGLEFFCQNSRTFKNFSRTLWTLGMSIYTQVQLRIPLSKKFAMAHFCARYTLPCMELHSNSCWPHRNTLSAVTHDINN